MSSYKVEICGVNTAKLPILKDEEKEALFERIHAGDKKARETYIEGNLRLQRIQDSGHHTEGWHQAAYRTYRTREEQMPKGGGKAVEVKSEG